MQNGSPRPGTRILKNADLKFLQIRKNRERMYFPNPQTIFKRLLANKRASQKARLTALERLPAVPVSLLLRLLADPDTPQRLLKELAARYEVEMTVRGKTNDQNQ